jgi:hypothetical protein
MLALWVSAASAESVARMELTALWHDMLWSLSGTASTVRVYRRSAFASATFASTVLDPAVVFLPALPADTTVEPVCMAAGSAGALLARKIRTSSGCVAVLEPWGVCEWCRRVPLALVHVLSTACAGARNKSLPWRTMFHLVSTRMTGVEVYTVSASAPFLVRQVPIDQGISASAGFGMAAAASEWLSVVRARVM